MNIEILTPKEVVRREGNLNKYYCPNCEKQIFNQNSQTYANYIKKKYNNCPKCGQAVFVKTKRKSVTC